MKETRLQVYPDDAVRRTARLAPPLVAYYLAPAGVSAALGAIVGFAEIWPAPAGVSAALGAIVGFAEVWPAPAGVSAALGAIVGFAGAIA
jgi:hypothetical protein